MCMLNSYIWRRVFPLPHALPCVSMYWFVNVQFWFCKWCHKLCSSEAPKPINRVTRKQDCRALHCYLTFALTTRHFRNKQAMDPWLRKLQVDSKSSCLILLTHSSCTAGVALLPPLTLAPKMTHGCLPCSESCSELGVMPGHVHDTHLLVCCSSWTAAWDVTCPFPTEGNLAQEQNVDLLWTREFIAAGLQKLRCLCFRKTLSCRGFQLELPYCALRQSAMMP